MYLFPNTWQYFVPCIPWHLGSIVSDAISPINLFVANILCVLYLLDKGIIADRTWCCVVASKVSLAWSTLIFQISLKSSGVVFECLFVDMNVRGGKTSSSVKGPDETLVSTTFDFIILALNTWISKIFKGWK